MKYIDADKIKTEIERLYDGEAPKHGQQCDFDDGYFTGIGAISKFIDALQDERPSEDLEKAVEESWFYYEYRDAQHLYSSCYKDGFKAGAEWQKEQMLKDAVNGEVVKTLYGSLRVSSYTFKRDGFEFGDKVKIIIVKED